MIHTLTSSSLAVRDAEVGPLFQIHKFELLLSRLQSHSFQTGTLVDTLAVPGISVIRDCSYSDMHGVVAIAADRTVQTIDVREQTSRSCQSARLLSDSIGGAECAVAAIDCSKDGR